MKILARQLTVDMYDCKNKDLSNYEDLRESLDMAMNMADDDIIATVMGLGLDVEKFWFALVFSIKSPLSYSLRKNSEAVS